MSTTYTGSLATVRATLRAHLITEESLRLKVYKDTRGFNTIGYGRNLDAKGVSQTIADLMLEEDMDEAIKDANTAFPWLTELTTARQVVLIDMLYNMGALKLLTFHKMIAAVISQDYEQAALEMMNSAWYKEVGTRGVKLVSMMRLGF